MPTRYISELQTTLATFRSLLENHERARSRLLERRLHAAAGAEDRLDQLLAVNRQTTDTLRRTIAALEEQLGELQSAAAAVPAQP